MVRERYVYTTYAQTIVIEMLFFFSLPRTRENLEGRSRSSAISRRSRYKTGRVVPQGDVRCWTTLPEDALPAASPEDIETARYSEAEIWCLRGNTMVSEWEAEGRSVHYSYHVVLHCDAQKRLVPLHRYLLLVHD